MNYKNNIKKDFINKVDLRPIKKGNLPSIVKWLNDRDINIYLADNNKDPLTLESQLTWFRAYKNDSQKDAYIIILENRPIGYCGLFRIHNYRAKLFLIIGHKELWGLGIAKVVINKIENIAAKKHQLNTIELEVDERNIRAVKLYENQGYTLIEGKSHAKNDPYNLYFSKKINK